MRRAASTALRRVRRLCLALPETSERPSHGAPTFFIAGKHAFVIDDAYLVRAPRHPLNAVARDSEPTSPRRPAPPGT